MSTTQGAEFGSPGLPTELTMVEALNAALAEEMERDESVFLIGEDIAAQGGLFEVTKGLLDRFGSSRVIDSPISEAAITGAAVGASLVAARPVVELQIFDFVTLAMDQLVNHAAKWRYMSGGQVSVPMVIRGPVSSGIGMAAQHSQSLEAWFVHTPGLVVVIPATPADAKGLLKSAIREDNPVVFLEKRLLYGRKGPVPQGEHLVPIGVADIKRTGLDVTIVATGMCVHHALQAARSLSQEDIEVEVIDPRTLRPLDMDCIAASLAKTGRLVVANEGPAAGGFASEVVSRVVHECYDLLSSQPERVTALDTPIPFAAALERAVLPTHEAIYKAALRTVGKAPAPSDGAGDQARRTTVGDA
jgi:pyruvate/2-oxoglutarate/acetoin dehydrogenase E1 component